MQSLLQQMSENPTMMSNMLNAPYTRTMLEALQADPDMASNVKNFFINCYKLSFNYIDFFLVTNTKSIIGK